MPISTFDELKQKVSFVGDEKTDQYLAFHSLVDSVPKLKELYTTNPTFTTKILQNKVLRQSLFKSIDDVQRVLSKSEDLPTTFDEDFTSGTSFLNYFYGDAQSNENNELKLFLQLLQYNEVIGLVNEEFFLKNAHALVKSKEDFTILISQNPHLAILLVNTSAVAEVMTIEHFYKLAQNHSPLVQAIALAIAKSTYVKDYPWNDEFFLQFAAVNLDVAHALLLHPEISQSVEKVKNHIQFTHLKRHFPIIPQRELKRSEVSALDLASVPLPKKKSHDEMTQQRKNFLEHQEKKVAERFLTTESFFDHMMFGGESGYYSSGRVDFKKDFVTFASNPKTAKTLASAFAYQLMMCRKNLIQLGTLKETDSFYVLECGAGNGNLCFNIQTVISQMAESKDPKVDEGWRGLHKSLSYQIVERSPELVKSQTQKNSTFIEQKKLNIINEDAKHLAKALPDKKMSAIISNELLDVFPPHQLMMGEAGDINVVIIVPSISKGQLQVLYPDNFQSIYHDLQKKSQENIALLESCYRFSPQLDVLYLIKNDYFKLHKLAVQQDKDPNIFSFLPYTINAKFFPEVATFVGQNKEFFARMHPGESELLNLGIASFVKNASDVLTENGMLISVDYGHNTELSDKRLRTYYHGKLEFDIFDRAGYKDMTYDINFSDMEKRSTALGMELLFFANQDAMLPNDAYFPEKVLSGNDREYFSKNKNATSFKTCIQYKKPTTHEQDLKSVTKSLFEKSQPVAYSDLFSNFKKKLTEIKPQLSGELTRITQTQEDFKLKEKNDMLCITHPNTDLIKALALHLSTNGISLQTSIENSQEIILPIREFEKLKAILPMQPPPSKNKNPN